MIRRLINAARRRLSAYRHGVRLPPAMVEDIVRQHGAAEWHIWGINQHPRHVEAQAAVNWIKANLKPDSFIFETGCGAGANLLWLAQRGFSRLAGADISPEAIAAAKELAKNLKNAPELWVDDALQPSRIPPWELLIAIDWTYLLGVGFDLSTFLTRYASGMRAGGVVIIDVVDSSFDQMPNNEFCTDDWDLPLAQRRPSQYALRLSRDTMESTARASGFEIAAIFPGSATPPRNLYVLKSRGDLH